MLPFDKLLIIILNWLVCPSGAELAEETCTIIDIEHFEHLPAEKLHKKLIVIAASYREPHDLPRVLLAPASTDAIEPSIQRPVVIFDVEVLL